MGVFLSCTTLYHRGELLITKFDGIGLIFLESSASSSSLFIIATKEAFTTGKGYAIHISPLKTVLDQTSALLLKSFSR